PVPGRRAPPGGRLGAPRPAAARADLPDHRDAAAVPRHADHLVHELERLLPGRGRVRRVRQLPAGAHRRHHARLDHHDDRAHRVGGAGQPGTGTDHRAPAGPGVPRPRDRPHDDDHAVPHRAGGGGAGVEARALQPGVRAVQRRVDVDLRGERPAARLDLDDAAHGGGGVAGLAVDAVHDADPAGRPAEQAARRHRGREDRRLLVVADLPAHDVAAPAPVPGAGRAARVDLHRAELRRRLHDHLGWPGYGQPALHDLPDLLQRARLRPGLGRGRRRGDRNDHHRHVRAADRVVAVPSGGGPMTATLEAPRTAAPPVNPPARNATGTLLTILAWVIGVLFVVPVLWMVLTSLHSEENAATNPPSVFAPLTLEGYANFVGAQTGTSPWPSLLNSLTASVLSTALVLVLAIPAAYALSIRPVRKWTDVLFFFLSTKMLPVVAGLLPVYLIAQSIGMLDNIWLLIILYTSMNLPIAVWMMRSFL